MKINKFIILLAFIFYNICNIQGQSLYDVFHDTILLVKDIGIKPGNEILTSKEYLLSADSIYFNRYPDWKIIEYHVDFMYNNSQNQSCITRSNKLTQEIKAHILNEGTSSIVFRDIKVINNKKTFAIKEVYNIDIANHTAFDKLIDINNNDFTNKVHTHRSIDLNEDTILILNDLCINLGLFIGDFKVLNEQGKLFEINKWIRIHTPNKNKFNKYLDRTEYKKDSKK